MVTVKVTVAALTCVSGGTLRDCAHMLLAVTSGPCRCSGCACRRALSLSAATVQGQALRYCAVAY
eukprot:882-Heterococcus_DN1.PRE.1